MNKVNRVNTCEQIFSIRSYIRMPRGENTEKYSPLFTVFTTPCSGRKGKVL